MTNSKLDSPWAYTHDVLFSNPVYSQLRRTTGNENKSDVALDAVNFRPSGGFGSALNSNTGATSSSNNNTSQPKIIYTLRHGNTPHNDDSRFWSRPVAWRYLAALHKNFDPQLTQEGIANVNAAGNILKGFIGSEKAPRPARIYTSPLRRCIETSMYMIKQAGLDQPAQGCAPVTLHVKEGLREWMGYGHGHQSDRKGGREDIRATISQLNKTLGMDVRYKLDVPKHDEFRDEVYVDVDRRVRGVLDDIFGGGDDAHPRCVMLVLHNRSNKSFLRVLGHRPDHVDGFDLANCAMLSYRVTRSRLDPAQVKARIAAEDAQRLDDLNQSETNKKQRLAMGVEIVRSWIADPGLRYRLHELQKLLEYHKVQRNDAAAGMALEMLAKDLSP